MARIGFTAGCLLWVAYLTCLPSTSSAKDTPVGSRFAQIVLKNFDTWDRYHTGVLTVEDLDWWMVNPSLKGEDAAAVAMLHKVIRKEVAGEEEAKLEHLPLFTREYFQRIDRLTPEQRKQEYDFDPGFRKCLAKLTRDSRALFAEGGADRDAIHQGSIGDCALLAVVGSLVTVHPDKIRQMIDGDQTYGYTVRFPKRAPVYTPPLTDAEVAMSASSEDNGLWLAVLEKAVGEIRRAASKKKRFVVPADALTIAPHNIEVYMGLLTGHDNVRIDLPDPARAPKAEEAEQRLRAYLLAPHFSQHLCTAASRKDRDAPPGMGRNHAYAVLGYNDATKLVHVWNPWGKNFIPKGVEGMKNGYRTTDGSFRIPMKDFLQAFRYVSIEGDTPVTRMPF